MGCHKRTVYNISLVFASVYSVLVDKIVGVYITLLRKYMFTLLNYNNKLSESIWSYLSDRLRPYSL